MSSWLAVTVAWFFSGALLTNLWVFALGLDILLRTLALVFSAAWIWSLLRRRRVGVAVLVLTGATAVAAIAFLAPWREIYPRIWFSTHHAAFVAAAELQHSGAVEVGMNTGGELPLGVRDISVDGTLVAVEGSVDDYETTQETCGGEPILFAPAWIGIPDGAIGFVHLACDSPPQTLILDGFGDDMTLRFRLADGWWWAN